MDTNGNSPHDVASLLAKLREDKGRIEQQITHAEEILALLGGGIDGSRVPLFQGSQLLEPNLTGLPLDQAIETYAKAHGEFKLPRLVDRLYECGLGSQFNSRQSASGAVFYRLGTRSKQYQKTGPGTFRYIGGSSAAKSNASTAPGPSGARRTLPMMATGRDYSRAPIPPAFKRFNLDRIRGKHYLEAAHELARFNGGSITYNDLNAMLWNAGMCGSVKRPGAISGHIYNSLHKPGNPFTHDQGGRNGVLTLKQGA